MDNKLEIIKSIRHLQNLGIQFDKLYTIDNDLDELKFALEMGNNVLCKTITHNKIKQLDTISASIGLETINPQVAKESPLNSNNWGIEVWKFMEKIAK